MIVVYDFRCENGHVFEDFVERECRNSRCDCGALATRIISPIHSVLDPISGHFPSATDKWAKHHEEMAKKPTP